MRIEHRKTTDPAIHFADGTPTTRKAWRLPVKTLSAVPGFHETTLDRKHRIADIMLVGHDAGYRATITLDPESRVVGLWVRLPMPRFDGTWQETLDKVQSSSLLTRIDPSVAEKVVCIRALSVCAREKDCMRVFEVLLQDVSSVLSDDRLQGLVKA